MDALRVVNFLARLGTSTDAEEVPIRSNERAGISSVASELIHNGQNDWLEIEPEAMVEIHPSPLVRISTDESFNTIEAMSNQLTTDTYNATERSDQSDSIRMLDAAIAAW